MGQRAMIAMMLIAGPELLIADEPTSALDVTVQLDVLRILDRLVAERGMGLIFISHDLRLVSSFCDRVIVMYAGKIVEQLPAAELCQRAASLHAGPAQLHAEDRRRPAPAARSSTASRSGPYDRRRLSSTSLSVVYRRLPCAEGRQPRRARKASPSASSANPVPASRRCCARSPAWRRSHGGSIAVNGQELLGPPRQGVLSPGPDGVPGPLRLAASAPDGRPAAAGTAGDPRHRRQRARILRALDEVGLGSGFRFRYSHQLSGGQRQRVAIARALILRAVDPAAGRADLGARRLGAGRSAQPARTGAARRANSPS